MRARCDDCWRALIMEIFRQLLLRLPLIETERAAAEEWQGTPRNYT